MNFIRKTIRAARNCIHDFGDTYFERSYSQEGEDMILRRTFEGRTKGFYVDVGAHHPRRFSNTQYFYDKGWRGINIDAAPGSIALFREQRPLDINIEAAIASAKKRLTFFIFNEPALNSFDETLSLSRETEHYRIVNRRQLETETLADILSRHLPHGMKIDFLSVDVEGLDFDVLQSNDWRAYRPEYVLVECPAKTVGLAADSETCKYLEGIRYEFFAKTVYTLFFRDLALD